MKTLLCWQKVVLMLSTSLLILVGVRRQFGFGTLFRQNQCFLFFFGGGERGTAQSGLLGSNFGDTSALCRSSVLGENNENIPAQPTHFFLSIGRTFVGSMFSPVCSTTGCYDLKS